MPAFVLGNAIAAILMRHTRSAMLQVLESDYVRTARAKGLLERTVILKHAMRNALTPVITLGALEFGTLLSGAVLTEQIFTIPGLRQADRRCRLQSRLRGRAGRRAGDGDDLYRAQSARRYRLYPGQSAAAWLNAWSTPPSMQRWSRPTSRRKPGSPRAAPAFPPQGRGFRAGVIVLFVALAVFAPLLAPYDPIVQSWTSVRKPPSALHWFGTDDVGRDVLVRVIYGARASLMAGVISVGIALSIGVPLGLAAGYLGGFLDALISRITDAMLACPFLILAIALAAFLGPSLGNAMIAIGVTTTPIFVRLTRGQVMAVKVEDYVEAARAVGNPRWRIALVHILPNILPALLVQATLVDRRRDHRRGRAFVPGPRPAAAGALLGLACSIQRSASSSNAPWMAVWPGVAIFLTVLSFNLVGDGLRDALDPREN